MKKHICKTMITKLKLLLLVGCLSMGAVTRAEMPTIKGEPFPDTDGVHINAHGGNIIKDSASGTYYWYGEHRGSKTDNSPQLGVAVYSSTDLRKWENRGIALPLLGAPGTPTEAGCTIERPKVVYCPNTGKYVMWFHNELKGHGYGAAFAGVAQSDTPVGPFKLIRSQRVNPGCYPEGTPDEIKRKRWANDMKWWTPEWYAAIDSGMFVRRDLYGGQMARDMTVYVDDDGKAYHVYSSEDNLTIQIAELDSTYTCHTGRYVRVSPGGHNEAPAIFKHDGIYWMITSGCTGWAPNEARLHRATTIMGPWEQLPNPCRGKGAEKTFLGQSTYVFVENGKYTFMADIWNPNDLRNSRHLWLPIQFDNNGTPFITKD